MQLEQKLEAILFFKGEPISIKRLMEILKVSREEIVEAILSLNTKLRDRGIVLMESDDHLTLGTNPELSSLIENLQKEELNKDLSKASLETLSIVLYKNGVTRSEIDFIRGVNSSFTLRLLAIRGLVDKSIDKKDSRRYIYKPSFQLLSFMGIKSVTELPDYTLVNKSIEQVAEELATLTDEQVDLENDPIDEAI